MSSRPFSSRWRISWSISNGTSCPPARTTSVDQVDLRLAGRRDAPGTAPPDSTTGSSPIFVQLEKKMSAKLGATIAWKP